MRPDISQFLVHFTKESESDPPYAVLRRILSEKRLLGASRFVRGGTECVCFSEAPLGAIEHGLINCAGFTRYSPFGLLFSKAWINDIGGLPVIYGPDCDFAKLPESLRWRHVRFELGSVDFTWEREWRLPCNELKFSEQDVTVVLPDDESRNRLIHDMKRDSFYNAWALTVVLGEEAWAYDRGNPWKTVTLKRVEPSSPPNAGSDSSHQYR